MESRAAVLSRKYVIPGNLFLADPQSLFPGVPREVRHKNGGMSVTALAADHFD